MTARTTIALLVLLAPLAGPLRAEPAADEDAPLSVLRPLFEKHCFDCHGPDGDAVDRLALGPLKSESQLVGDAELVADVLEAVDSGAMPPDDYGTIPTAEREQFVRRLRKILHRAIAARPTSTTPVRRMTRLQYNNAVQDLLQLNVVVFPLPERMMREHGGYFQPASGKMPDVVKVGSRPLGKSQLIERRLAGVTPFPQDRRAEHGFDNRGDHLSLSPLLLEAFLKLGRSIVESPDFGPKTVGIWGALFAPSNTDDVRAVARDRLRSFLTRAFRRPVEDELLERYVEHVMARIGEGESHVDAMKSAVAAALASPRFFYLYDRGEAGDDFDLASRLSFFLWGSIPDERLLELAAAGTINEPEVLAAEVDRMLRDRKLKRFCDAFPTQWLQLERIVSSTPDQSKWPQFYFSKYRASMHMMLEPLLLFETVVIENRSVLDLIDPDFSYRSDLLQAWYREGKQGKVGPPTVVTFRRVPLEDRRFGGVMTNAAVMTMNSGTHRSKPITRGAWVASVILNAPPEPPPADVPPLPEKPMDENLTLRERFAAHRTSPSCAGCHTRIDPLGFAFENFDAAGLWREKYDNGRDVDASGTLFGRHEFENVVDFKDALLVEKDRVTKAFAGHVLSYALGRELDVADGPALNRITAATADDEYRFHTLIKEIVRSKPFLRASEILQSEEKSHRDTEGTEVGLER